MKKILVLTFALMMALSLAACGGGNDDKAPSGGEDKVPGGNQQTEQNTLNPGTSQQADQLRDTPDESQPSGEPGNASVEWPENEWTKIIPKAADTVMKIDENMSTGMGNAYVIYMDWTDEDALAYGQKIAETGVTAGINEDISSGKFEMLYTDPNSGRMVQITELGEVEDDYVIVLYK